MCQSRFTEKQRSNDEAVVLLTLPKTLMKETGVAPFSKVSAQSRAWGLGGGVGRVSLGFTHCIGDYYTVACWGQLNRRSHWKAILVQFSEINCGHWKYLGKRNLFLEILILLTGDSQTWQECCKITSLTSFTALVGIPSMKHNFPISAVKIWSFVSACLPFLCQAGLIVGKFPQL